MNAFNMARTAYAPAHAAVRTAQSIEYEAFAKVTRDIKLATEQGATGFVDLVAALHKNRQLWMILATSVADAANALPKDLRARIFYLAEFTNHHTSLVLKRQADAGALVDVNGAIMRGIRQQETLE